MSAVSKIKDHAEAANRLAEIQSEVSGATPDDVLALVLVLVDARYENAFELGGYLSRVKREKLYPEGMAFTYWMQSIGVAQSTGNAKIQVYEAIINCGLSMDVLSTVEWSKLRLVSSMLSPAGEDDAGNAEIIEVASTLSRLELNDWIQHKKSEAEPVETPEETAQPTNVPDTASKAVNADMVVPKVTKTPGTASEVAEVVEGDAAALRAMMQQFEPEDVLGIFEEIWPDIDVTVSL